eukprot:UN23205
MDVVPANPEEWEKDPFKLTFEDDDESKDKVYGRGVTDCSGHVGMFTHLFKQLAETKFKPNLNIYCVFIANEENSSLMGIGIDELTKQGELKALSKGPLYWVDSADFGPTNGTAGMMCWECTVKGKKFHSGMPHKGINALECNMEVVHVLQQEFYKKFPSLPEQEKKYKFLTSSSMKPTQVSCPPGWNKSNSRKLYRKRRYSFLTVL